jgi:hypothetical protein
MAALFQNHGKNRFVFLCGAGASCRQAKARLFVILSAELALPNEPYLESRNAGVIFQYQS